MSSCPICRGAAGCACHLDLVNASGEVANALRAFIDATQATGFDAAARDLLASLHPFYVSDTSPKSTLEEILQKPFRDLLGPQLAGAKALMWMHEGRQVQEEPLFSDSDIAEIQAGVYPNTTLQSVVSDKEIFADTLLGIYRADGTPVFERSFRDIP